MEMLPRERRLKERTAWRRVYEQGRSWGHPLAVLYALPQPPPSKRFGLAVGKGVGKAVQRNRVRRRLRHIVYSLEPRVREGAEYIIRARPTAGQTTFDDLIRAVGDLLRRAGALRADDSDTAPYAWPAGGRRPEERTGGRRSASERNGSAGPATSGPAS